MSHGYDAYLASKHWRTTRERMFARYGRVCQECGATENIHVHHLTYVRIGAELDEDLEILCGSCHRRAHGMGASVPTPDVTRHSAQPVAIGDLLHRALVGVAFMAGAESATTTPRLRSVS